MEDIVVVNQFFGIGDVIFEQTIVNKIANGRRIIWPVLPQFVEQLNRAYPDIEFVAHGYFPIDAERRDRYFAIIGDEKKRINAEVLPMRWCDTNMMVPYSRCMEVKYTYFGDDYKTWKEKAMWKRDTDREDELFHLLQLDGKEYTLTNRFFGSNSQFIAKMPSSAVEMYTREGFSLFDWAKVIENASAIHTVSTSIVYLLELLDLKAQEVHLYARKPLEQNLDTVKYLLERHKYVLHE